MIGNEQTCRSAARLFIVRIDALVGLLLVGKLVFVAANAEDSFYSLPDRLSEKWRHRIPNLFHDLGSTATELVGVIKRL